MEKEKKFRLNKKIIVAIGVLVLATLLSGMFVSNASKAETELTMDDIRRIVSDQYPGTITELELDKEFNKAVYEVEVESNGREYELKIDGNSGEILKLKEKYIEQEKTNDVKKEVADSNKEKIDIKKESKNETVITEQQAIDIALKEFPGEVTDIELDEDDGMVIYEIEITYGTEEADIDIDAHTGEIVIMEIEAEDD